MRVCWCKPSTASFSSDLSTQHCEKFFISIYINALQVWFVLFFINLIYLKKFDEVIVLSNSMSSFFKTLRCECPHRCSKEQAFV